MGEGRGVRRGMEDGRREETERGFRVKVFV